MKKIVTKLYFDTGSGFNEEQTISHTIDSNCNKVEFMFNPLGVNMLRFVPINDYSVLHVSSIAIVREDNSSYKLGNYQTNALCQKNNDLIFTDGWLNEVIKIFESRPGKFKKDTH